MLEAPFGGGRGNNVPRFEKLSPEEAQQLGRSRQSVLDLSEYHGFLSELEPGEWGRLHLEEGETQRTIKRRFTTAAKQQGKALRYRKAPDCTF